MPERTKQSEKSWLRPTIISAICAGFLFVIANSAFWVNRYVFDTGNFTQVATASLTSESSRRAIATEITNRALADYPTARNIIDDTMINVVSGILGSDQVENVLTKAISKLQVSVTSSDPQSLVISLEGPKEFLTKIVDVISKQRQVNVNPDNIPSEIVLINKDNIPNFYKYGVLFLWLGPIALVGGLVLLVFPYVKWRESYKRILLVQGVAVALASVLALLIGPLFRPPLLSKIPSPETRIVATNLYNAFIATFNQQTYVVVGVGVLAMLIAAAMLLITQIRSRR